jgi:hypothetical protein
MEKRFCLLLVIFFAKFNDSRVRLRSQKEPTMDHESGAK